jgi:WD40 repeat protein/tRNA A-37 threonylcarbamoyl transferase component Bud32
LTPLLRGHYRVIQVLSDEGGFGRTYLAEDVDKLNERCVVKQLAPKVQEASALKKAVDLFQQEAKRLQQLGEHDQIPTLLAYFEQDNYLFLVQQYIDGQNLLQELQKHGTYSEKKIQELLLDLLPVLQFIHQRGVIHRDIKPQNIIRRSSDKRLVLIDFGASKDLTATVQHRMGTTIGSHGYTAVEQMQEGKASPASDLFSLGATCFHLMFGISPFQLWVQHGFGWVDFWQRYSRAPGMGGVAQAVKLNKIIDKLLKVDVRQRYQSVDEVLKDLTVTLPPSGSPTLVAAPSPPIHQKLKYQLLIGVGVLLLGSGGVWYSQSRPLMIMNSSNPTQPINSELLNTLKGHSSDVNSVVFSPDGKTLASASDDETIKLWNPATGKETQTLKGHSQWVWTVAFSPDGKILASGSADKTIKLWDLEKGTVINTLVGHTDGVTGVAFSPDGKTLASGSLDKTIKLWNVGAGKEICTLKGHSKAIASVAFSPDGATLASGSWDKTIKLWNLVLEKEIRTLVGHSDLVLSVTFSPDGVTLASGSKDKTIKLWNLVTGQASHTLKQHSDKVNSVTYVPNSGYNKTSDGYILASGSSDNTVKLWNVITGQEIRTLKHDSGYVYSVAASPDGATLASGGTAGNTLSIWRLSH